MFNGIFVDEDTLGVAYELERTHPGDIYYVGHPDMPEIPRSTKDPALLAALGANETDFIFLTRDKRIRHNKGERQQLMSAAIRAVFLSGKTTWRQARWLLWSRSTGTKSCTMSDLNMAQHSGRSRKATACGGSPKNYGLSAAVPSLMASQPVEPSHLGSGPGSSLRVLTSCLASASPMWR